MKSTWSRMSAARSQDAGDEGLHVGGEPVVGDDAVPLAEHVAEAVDVDERGGDVPRGVHGVVEPFAGGGEVVGGRPEVPDEVA